MEVTTSIVTVSCLVDDWLTSQPPRRRQRGLKPTLADCEVLTIECVGEFLGIDTDSGLYQHVRRHWTDWFPDRRRVHRTSFVRQARRVRKCVRAARRWYSWEKSTEQVASMHPAWLAVADDFQSSRWMRFQSERPVRTMGVVCAGINRHGEGDERALHRRRSDPRWPRVMRRRS
jgi:hypothetical protein